MRAVVTRVREARVTVLDETVGRIGHGLLILLGVGPDDTEQKAQKLAEKICRLRIFEDETGKMNLDLNAVGGKLLAVSQFTLYADTKSRRPGFSAAAPPELAKDLYEHFLSCCQNEGFFPERGRFGAHMEVYSVNDGPVTLLLEV